MSTHQPRILCVIETIGRGGGAEQLLASLVPEMRRQGANVEVAALFDWPDDLGIELERESIPLHRLEISSPGALTEAARKLRRLLAPADYDVFWGHLYYGNFYAWLARRLAGSGKLAVTLHSEGYLQFPPTGLRARLAAAMEARLLKAADLRIAVSEAVRADYAAYFRLEDIQVVHNGVDHRRIEAMIIASDPQAVRKQFGFATQDFLLVTPARYVPKKGHRVLLDALELLRDEHRVLPKAFFCGAGPLQESIVEDVSRRGLTDQVTVSAVVPHEQLMPLIASAQTVVMPSLREPFGIAAAEAMVVGTPCVLTNVDGFRELTAGCDCAMLVPPADARSLAKAILELHADSARGARLARRAKAHVEKNFTIARCASRWKAVLG